MKDDLLLIIQAIRYIEDNLKEKLTLDLIAGEIGFSKYYFVRLFAGYTGQSPYDYYRGRKLTETINYLQQRGCKIIDAAYEYGFSSPEVFARACATVFGKSPSVIRREIVEGNFKGIEPISEGYLWFTNSYTGKPIFKVLDGLNLSGVGYFSDKLDESLYTMPKDRLSAFNQKEAGQLFKLTWMDPQAMGYMNFIGVRRGEDTDHEMLLSKSLPKMAYVIFELTVDRSELKYFYRYVYDRWLPEHGYDVVMPLNIEVFSHKGSVKTSSLYIPVIPK